MADTLPATSDGRADNPFRAVAILLDGVRIGLESSKRQDQAPRWVRVVRVREFRDDAIAWRHFSRSRAWCAMMASARCCSTSTSPSRR